MFTIPNEFYAKTRDWIKTIGISTELIPYYYKVIYPEQTVTLQSVKGVDAPRWVTECSFEEAFTVVIPNGRVITSNCYVVTPDHKRLQDVELDCPWLRDVQLPEPEYRDESVATLVWGWNLTQFAGSTQNVFGHWFFDILPRLHLLEKSGIPIDKYLIPKLQYPFHYESLELLGIPADKLIQVTTPDFHLVASRLVVPAVPLMLGKCPPWASHYMNKRLKHDHNIMKKDGYEKIYITREDARARFVVNEDEVMSYLEPLGFRKILLTPLSTEEKIAIFSAARTIVAPFGSGSSFVTFCEPGAKLIELAPHTFADNYFWKLSSYASVHYYELICEVEQPPNPFVGADNMIVDINKLKKVLQLAGI